MASRSLARRTRRGSRAAGSSRRSVDSVDSSGTGPSSSPSALASSLNPHRRSRSSNYGGILSQGLRIAPPEAPAPGYLFGASPFHPLRSTLTRNDGEQEKESISLAFALKAHSTALTASRTTRDSSCSAKLSSAPTLSTSANKPKVLSRALALRTPTDESQYPQYEAAELSKKAGMLSTWGIGRTQPASWVDASVLSPELAGVRMPTPDEGPEEVNQKSACVLVSFFRQVSEAS